MGSVPSFSNTLLTGRGFSLYEIIFNQQRERMMSQAAQGEIVARGDLPQLLCGVERTDKSEIDEVLDHISTGLTSVVEEVIDIKNKSDKYVMLYGPFLGRSILELGCTAIIARLDPFRILLLQEKQKQPSFVLDRPHKSSIRWQGDVMSEGRVSDLWDDKALQNPTRALLGDYFAELIWNRNVDSLLDAIDTSKRGCWFDQIRQYDSNTLTSRVRGDMANLYSSLSKGIHHELVIPLAASFDRSTVVELINGAIYNIASLGLISHIVRHSYNSAAIASMIDCFDRLQNMEVR